MFDNIKDAMTFTKGERVAIIVLAAVILFIIAANFFIANRPSDVKENLCNLDSIMALHKAAVDELEARHVAEQIERGTRIQKIKEENEKRKKQKLKKPEFMKEDKITGNVVLKKEVEIVNLNKADTLTLQSLPEIGSYFARNIVSYREKLGGFIELDQLLEVYAFDSARLETITPYVNIDSVLLRKINVNTDDFKTILRHPYIEYEDVKKIVNHRESKGMIKNWETYLEIVGRDDVDERLKWYLEF